MAADRHKSRPRREKHSPSRPQGRRRFVTLLLTFLSGAAFAVALAFVTGGSGGDVEVQKQRQRDLSDILAMAPDRLPDVDIAEMNLLCASGLPGTEDLDVAACLATLDRWADRVRSETERHRYRLIDPQYAEPYRNSEAFFRASMLVQVLQEDCGVHYNKQRIREIDFTDSRDLFLHGMVLGDGGTCVSMPVLYVAMGRRLRYPMFLVLAKAHVFARWDDPERGERFNIEGSGEGFSSFPDEHYKTWPMEMTEAEVKVGHYLKSLAPGQELAVFMAARGHCLEDTGCLPEARLAYAQAHRCDPKSREYLGFLAQAVGSPSGRSRVAGSRRPMPRDPMAELRRIEAINAYNRRLMGRSFPGAPPVPSMPAPVPWPARSPPDAMPPQPGRPR